MPPPAVIVIPDDVSAVIVPDAELIVPTISLLVPFTRSVLSSPNTEPLISPSSCPLLAISLKFIVTAPVFPLTLVTASVKLITPL